MTKELGLVFVDSDTQVYLGKFVDGTIKEFVVISDFDEIYLNLPLTAFSVVEINATDNEKLTLTDICQMTPYTDKIDGVPIIDILTSLMFPSPHSDELFNKIFEVIKTEVKPCNTLN